MKKKIIIITVIIIVFLAISVPITIVKIGTPTIEKININNKLNDDNTKTIEVKFHNPFNKKLKCALEENNKTNKNTKWIKIKNNSCSFNVNAGSYYIFFKNEKGEINNSSKKDIIINEILDLKLKKEKIFLTIGETYKIESEIISLGEVDESLTYTSNDENIIKINEDVIEAISSGNTTVTIKTTNNLTKELNVIVTDLYKKYSQENNRNKLPCNLYTQEEARLLDEILEYRINKVGYQTRGAVVEAARFLVLEFPYRVPYFFENGRLNNYDGKSYVDGEGRYYKKGLYLHEEKFNTILASSNSGPAIWGCPLTNWQDEYGYKPGVKYPNGLDCSGFVTWALFNAGFDVGDSGAGDTYRTDDIGDLGIKHELTKDFALNGKYKVGDLIGRDGHIAIIAGIDDENIYIAESLVGGVVIKEFAKNGSKLYRLYGFINTMDEVYKEEGIYTNMW